MALLFMDGFDAGDYALKWPSGIFSGGTGTTSSTRFSTGLAYQTTTNLGAATALKRNFSAVTKVIVGFAIRVPIIYNNEDILILYGDTGATTHLRLRMTNSGQVALYRNLTLLAVSPINTYAVSTWCYIEMSATIDSTVGQSIVRVNGIEVINFTGNTKNGGTNNTIDRVDWFVGSAKINTAWDDVYICDGTGPAPYNNFLGDVRVYSLSPTGPGASTQWTPDTGSNYARVNEMPYSAANYVQSKTPGQRDTYALADLPAGTITVYGVQNNIIARKTDAGFIAVKPVIVTGGTPYFGTNANLAPNDVVLSDLRTTNPSTSAAWTASGVNGIEVGMEIA